MILFALEFLLDKMQMTSYQPPPSLLDSSIAAGLLGTTGRGRKHHRFDRAPGRKDREPLVGDKTGCLSWVLSGPSPSPSELPVLLVDRSTGRHENTSGTYTGGDWWRRDDRRYDCRTSDPHRFASFAGTRTGTDSPSEST